MNTETVETVETVEEAPSQFDRELFIKQYNETGNPKQRKIPCTVTGKMVTMFSHNLRRRVEKFGSVEALLDGFVSRGAKKK